jgi:2'-5' RNA ligase
VPGFLFVAVVPPASATRELRDSVEEVAEEFPALHWEAPSRWHLTVCFLGPVPPTSGLSARLAQVAARTAPIPLELGTAGHFGDRVLWAGVSGDLKPLAEAVRAAALSVGLEVESRPYRPHLTLARGRQGARLAGPLRRLHGMQPQPFTVDELVLLRSARPDYERIAGWPLAG